MKRGNTTSSESAKQPFEASGDLAIKPEAVGLTWPRAPRDDRWGGSTVRSGVAVIRICGPLEHHGGGWWFESYESILERVEGALQHEDVTSVILDIDSPGGEVSGLQETVRRIRAMRAQYDKPIVAFANDEAYSAAYALACSADEIYMPEGGGVGSIGVLATLCDRTAMTKKMGLRIEVVRSGERKAEGHPDLPMTDGTIARVRARVDDLAKQFFALVAEVRPTTRKKLAALEGACLYGQDAVDAGLADGIASFEDVLASLAEDGFDKSKGQAVPSNPNDRSDGLGAHAMNFAALKKKVADTLAALTAAKTAASKKTAAAAYAKAVAALTEAKVKKSYKKKTVEEEEETDDGEEDADEDADEEAEEDADEEAADPPSDDDDDEDDEDDDEDDDAKKGKKGKAAAAVPVGPGTSASLAAFVKRLTGKKSTAAAMGVLQAMADGHERISATEAQVARLRADSQRKRRTDLIDAGMREGKLTPGQKAWAKTLPISSLKAYLETTAPRFAPRAPVMPGASLVNEHASASLADDVPNADGMTAKEIEICRITGVTHESYKKQRALDGGAPLPKVN